MSDLKRFHPSSTKYGLKMEDYEDGDYVEYEQAAAVIRQLQARNSELELYLFDTVNERNELAATVERLRGAYHQLIGNADTIVDDFGNVLIAECDYNDLCKVVEATPPQNLAEHDADVARKAYCEGFIDGCSETQEGYLGNPSLTEAKRAEQYAQRIKDGS